VKIYTGLYQHDYNAHYSLNIGKGSHMFYRLADCWCKYKDTIGKHYLWFKRDV